MCDTALATENFTSTKKRIFAKNSNREPNEAHSILHIPRIEHGINSKLKTTYIQIPQVETTFEVFLCKPFHIWGAEMGVNEYGVVIGNEAVFTNLPLKKTNLGLSGMDLIRLALERGKSALQALHIITELLEEYGQDANGGYHNKNFFYHNSFLIADRTDGYLLETADRHWVAKKVTDFTSISNGLTIDSDYELSSKFLEDKIQKQLGKSPGDFSFRKYFSDWFYTKFSYAEERKTYFSSLAHRKKKSKGNFELEDMIEILKSHPQLGQNDFQPSRSSMKSICLHAKGITTPNQTNGSLVVEWDTSEISQQPLQILFTGTSTPCLSLFKPFWFGTKNFIENRSLLPNETYEEGLWWLNEAIIRRANHDYTAVQSILIPAIEPVQADVLRSIPEAKIPSKKEELQWKFLKEHVNILKQTVDELKTEKIGLPKWEKPFFNYYWNRQNSNLKFPMESI